MRSFPPRRPAAPLFVRSARDGTRVLVPLCALALLVSACASSDSRAAEFAPLGTPLAPEGRSCEVAAEPQVLPQVAALLDAAALQREAVVGPAPFVLSVRIGPSGRPEWVEVLDDGGDEPGARRAVETVRASLRPQPRSREGWGVRLALGSAAEPDPVVTRVLHCPPQPIRTGARRMVTQLVRSDDLRSGPPTGETRIDIEVGADGVMRRAEIAASSGSPFWDREMLEMANALRFRPALQDGFPVAGTHTLRARVRSR